MWLPARWCLPRRRRSTSPAGPTSSPPDVLSGYWHYVADLRDGMAGAAAYEQRLRPALEHLLAARLAERHGINLYRDPGGGPAAAVPTGGRDDDLWAWIDPVARPGASRRPRDPQRPPAASRGRTLERLIDRLEQL